MQTDINKERIAVMTNKVQILASTAAIVMKSGLGVSNLRGVTAQWKGNVAYFDFYFSCPPTENEIDAAQIATTEVIASFSEGFTKERFLVREPTKPLPESDFWVFRSAADL